jgi:hypothetical protein
MRLTLSYGVHLAFVFLLLLASESDAQGLIPANRQELESLDPIQLETVQYQRILTKNLDSKIQYRTQNYTVQVPIDLPNSVSLEDVLPPVGTQQGNDCVGWAMAYGLYSTIVASERGEKPDESWEKFSPRFIYKKICNGKDEGGQIFSKTQPSAVDVVRKEGCASLETCPYLDGPKTWLSMPIPSVAKIEASLLTAANIKRVPNLEFLKKTIASRIPVILGIETDKEFMNWKDNGIYQFKGDNIANEHKYHAILAVGYDDDRRAIRVLNSWGKNWKDAGLCWVSYDSLNQIEFVNGPNRNWCFEAYAVWLTVQRYPKIVSVEEYTLELTANKDVFWRRTNNQRVKTSISDVADVCASKDEIYMIKNGEVFVWAEMLNQQGKIDKRDWFKISNGKFPQGLVNHGANGGALKATMITGTPRAIYILGDNGIVYGRYEAESILESRWEMLVLPESLRCVDIRTKNLKLYATSSKGTVFERIPGSGWKLLDK